MPRHPGGHSSFWFEGQKLRSKVDEAIGSFASHEAAEAIYAYVAAANRYIVQEAPWTLLKEGDDPAAAKQFERTLAELFDGFRVIADPKPQPETA